MVRCVFCCSYLKTRLKFGYFSFPLVKPVQPGSPVRKALLITGPIGMAVGMFAISALAFNNIIGIGTLIFIMVPETKGKSLEEMEKLWKKR